MATATITRPAPAKKTTKQATAQPAKYPADSLTGEAWRTAYNAYDAWTDGGSKCLGCGVQILQGYDGRQDRTWRHMHDGPAEGSIYCHP